MKMLKWNGELDDITNILMKIIPVLNSLIAAAVDCTMQVTIDV